MVNLYDLMQFITSITLYKELKKIKCQFSHILTFCLYFCSLLGHLGPADLPDVTCSVFLLLFHARFINVRGWIRRS